MTIIEFAEWLKEELDKRSWRQADLAKNGGINTGLLSRIMNMERQPGTDTCKGIEKAFGMTPEEVYRRAGLLPYLPEEDDMIKRITSRLRALLADRRGQAVLAQIETIVDALYKQTLGNSSVAEDKQPYGEEKK